MENKKEKCAFLINSLQVGGAERVVQTIVNELCEQYEVHLITLEANIVFKLDSRVILHNLTEVGSKKINVIKLFSLIPLAFLLKKYLLKNNIVLVQSNLYRANYVNILAKLLGSAHTATITDHSLIDSLYGQGLTGLINRVLIKLFYKYADASICVSSKVKHQLSKIVDLPVRTYVINNPFDRGVISSKSNESIDDFHFEEDNVYLIAVGRINSIKRYDLIIKSLNLLNNDKICLIVIGQEEDVKLSDLLQLSINAKNIYFLGQKLNPYKYIKMSDILVLTSDSESFGNVLIESMVCGTPVISTRSGGPEDIITNYINGILVDLGDMEQLASAINELVLNSDLRLKLVENALMMTHRYELYNIINEYKGVLRGGVMNNID